MIPKMVHQPKFKRIHLQTIKHKNPSLEQRKTWNHTRCAKWKLWKHIKITKQKNNVLKSQITKSNLKSHNKGLYPKCEKAQTYSHSN
jgi:hypothetical protein